MVDYEQWIIMNVAGDGMGLCRYYSGYMAMSFIELVRVCGTYVGPDGTRSGHFWCRTEDGTIVDPTAQQFEPGGDYEEHHVAPLDYEDLLELVSKDTPIFGDLELWVQQHCLLWLQIVEKGRTNARPGTGPSRVSTETGVGHSGAPQSGG